MAKSARAIWLCLLAGCGSDATSAGGDTDRRALLSIVGLPALAATDGRYEVWSVGADGGATRMGVAAAFPATGVELSLPAGASRVLVTWEPPNDQDAAPSRFTLLHGARRGASVDLTVTGALTLDGVEVQRAPGQFTMFSPSDNAERGYPSFEESGVWLFNMTPRTLPQNDMWVRLAQLQPGWVYEGWMVRDIDQVGAIWLSYGKFTPDATGAVNRRDDTGWGAFSGVRDFLTAGEEEFPGDDWISNPLGYPLPAGLSLPLNLREKDARGVGRWTHVITIEPASDRGEAITTERPFVLRPYRDAFGDGGPGIPRTITLRADGVPSGRLVLP
ncbi:MAG: hypothetical protein JNJ98_11230 [Gemmatimonadetes bacterium]|nr:hypothetical protein [Gemmatimonadota bacterium]